MDFNKIIYKILDDMEIEARIFIIVASVGALLGFLGTVTNLIFGLGIYSVLSNLLASVLLVVTIVMAIKYDKYDLYSQLAMIVTSVIFFPSLWITGGGSKGAAIYFFVFNFLLIAVWLNKVKPLRYVVLNIVVMFFLIMIELLKPTWIRGYETEMGHFFDVTFHGVIVCLIVFFIAHRVMRAYTKKINRLNEVEKELTEISITDFLSGLRNRRYLISVIKASLKIQDKMILVLIDVDQFKNVNDRFGYTKGDKVIRGIAKILTEVVGNQGEIGRFGGEEFLIILKDLSMEEAKNIAEKIRIRVENNNWKSIRHTVTISGGVYEVNSEDTLDSALEKSDYLLYAAKDQGRNRIES